MTMISGSILSTVNLLDLLKELSYVDIKASIQLASALGDQQRSDFDEDASHDAFTFLNWLDDSDCPELVRCNCYWPVIDGEEHPECAHVKIVSETSQLLTTVERVWYMVSGLLLWFVSWIILFRLDTILPNGPLNIEFGVSILYGLTGLVNFTVVIHDLYIHRNRRTGQ